jgi:hypothetical protein
MESELQVTPLPCFPSLSRQPQPQFFFGGFRCRRCVELVPLCPVSSHRRSLPFHYPLCVVYGGQKEESNSGKWRPRHVCSLVCTAHNCTALLFASEKQRPLAARFIERWRTFGEIRTARSMVRNDYDIVAACSRRLCLCKEILVRAGRSSIRHLHHLTSHSGRSLLLPAEIDFRNIKHALPLARIKKIMRSDEDLKVCLCVLFVFLALLSHHRCSLSSPSRCGSATGGCGSLALCLLRP